MLRSERRELPGELWSPLHSLRGLVLTNSIAGNITQPQVIYQQQQQTHGVAVYHYIVGHEATQAKRVAGVQKKEVNLPLYQLHSPPVVFCEFLIPFIHTTYLWPDQHWLAGFIVFSMNISFWNWCVPDQEIQSQPLVLGEGLDCLGPQRIAIHVLWPKYTGPWAVETAPHRLPSLPWLLF